MIYDTFVSYKYVGACNDSGLSRGRFFWHSRPVLARAAKKKQDWTR